MTKCNHQDIMITVKERYNFPQGWKKFSNQKETDLGKYLIESEQTAIFCENCGEFLPDN